MTLVLEVPGLIRLKLHHDKPLSSFAFKCKLRRYIEVMGVHGVVMIAAGSFHALALQEDGRVLSWGNGDYGQLGLGTALNEDVPRVVEVGAYTRPPFSRIRAVSAQEYTLTLRDTPEYPTNTP
jgi:hypothetical protein